MKKLFALFTSLALVGIQLVQAQTVKITGTVTSSEDGMPLPGVSVVASGTTTGTATNIDGKYELSIPASTTTLEFTFVGYKTQAVAVAGKSVINIILETESLGLEEVVVVGYGVKTKQSKTGALSVVKSEDIASTPVSSVDKALQGKVAGVQINSASGAPGSSSTITIRGASSVNAGTTPLWVVDGIPVVTGYYGYAATANNPLASINPNDIESMTILKDAAATAIYGSRASNGVILVTTKSGKAGKSNINLRAETGVSTLASSSRNFRFMNAEESLDYWRAAATNAGIDPDNPASGSYYLPRTLLSGPLTNWFDEVLQTGKTQEVELSITGGNENTKFFFSGGYYDQEGIQINSFLERLTARVNVEHKINNKLKVSFKVSGAEMKIGDTYDELAYANPFWAAQSLLPWHNVRKPDGTWNDEMPENGNTNPVQVTTENDRHDRQNMFKGIGSLEWSIIDGLTFRSNNSVDYIYTIGRDFRSPLGDGDDTNGKLYNGVVKSRTLTTSNTLTYTKTINDVHNITAMAGFEAQDDEWEQYDMSGTGMGIDIPYLNNASGDYTVGYNYGSWSMLSYFVNADYNFNEKYYLTASFRADGCSRFGEDNRYGFFPAFGGAWNAHNEDFIKDIDIINLLKVRASYGTTGNSQIENYEALGTYTASSYNGLGGLRPYSLAKPNLTWELSKTYNIGVDFGLFDRLEGSIEYFNKRTVDMLLDVPVSYTSGFSSVRKNTGEMKVQGIELLVNGAIIKTNDIKLNLGFNITYNKYEITDLAGQDMISNGFFKRYRVGGKGFSEFYVYDWAGVNPLNGMGLWYDADGNLTEKQSNARRVFRGQVEPDYYGGFNLDFSWKGLSLGMQFEYKLGNYVMVQERYYTESDGYNFGAQTDNLLDYWKKPGDIASAPKPIVGNTSGSNAWGTSRFLEKGDYLRFKQLSISYTLPKSLIEKIKLEKARIYASAYNIYCWHDVSYFDPERGFGGGGYALYPNPFTVTFGIELGI